MIIFDLTSTVNRIKIFFTKTTKNHRKKEDGLSSIGDYIYQRVIDSRETVENLGNNIDWHSTKAAEYRTYFYLYNPKYNKSIKVEFNGFQNIQRRK